MPKKKSLPDDVEIMVNGRMEPLLLEGGQRVKSFSIGSLADFEEAWRKHGKKVWPAPGLVDTRLS